MSEPHSPIVAAFGRAGRRAAYHIIQAMVEGLRAIEAVIEEIGGIAVRDDQDEGPESPIQKIEIE
jgi:hypothetical protein